MLDIMPNICTRPVGIHFRLGDGSKHDDQHCILQPEMVSDLPNYEKEYRAGSKGTGDEHSPCSPVCQG